MAYQTVINGVPTSTNIRPTEDQQQQQQNKPLNPFTADYMANPANGFQPNPFQPGTKEFKNFQESQIKTRIDMAGQPNRPTFNSQIDPATGLLRGNLQAKDFGVGQDTLDSMQNRLNGVQLNKNPLQALEAEGTRTGPSAWANLMQKGIDERKLANLDTVGAQAQGANAGALSSLAMRGGLNSGARTSLAKDMQRGINANSQMVNRGAASDTLNLGVQDETKRMGVLSALPGQELAALEPEMKKATDMNAAALNSAEFNAGQSKQANQFNIQNSLNENLQNRGFDINNYNELMKAWGAGKTADAQGGGGKK